MEFSRLHNFCVEIVRYACLVSVCIGKVCLKCLVCKWVWLTACLCLCSETLQLSTLHFVLQLMASSFENTILNKRERELALAWSHR